MTTGVSEEAFKLVTLVFVKEVFSDLFLFGADFLLLLTRHDSVAPHVLPSLRFCTKQTSLVPAQFLSK